ncbi:MAG: hypothetical protein GX352_03210 [Clostridiales bacterium]|nr:hypothetical protein [Clostridiales bacterium]
MKRKLVLLSALVFLTLAVVIPIKAADLDLVYDDIGLLTGDERSNLNELAQSIADRHQFEVSIVILNDVDGNDPYEYAKLIYEEYNYGYGDNKSGLMLLLGMEDRDFALIAHGFGNTAFTDHGKDVLLDRHVLPLLKKDKYYEAFNAYLNESDEYLRMAKEGKPFDIDTDKGYTDEEAKKQLWTKLGITFLVPLIIAGLITFAFYKQMKTAVPQRAADSYIPQGGFTLIRKSDTFLFRNVTRRVIEDKSSKGGTSVDRRGYSGKSGKF